MRTHIQRALGIAAVALLAACQDDPATAPLDIQPNADVAAGARVYQQIERLGNPLVSEVMLEKRLHHEYNKGIPTTDVAEWTNELRSFVTGVAGRDAAYASTIAGALVPDMLLTYPKRDGTPVFWLSWLFGWYGGRTYPDDTVDTGLGAIFGDLLGNTNNVTPGLTTDNVDANDVPFRSTFPYLAAAH